jgi:hypothetical protein
MSGYDDLAGLWAADEALWAAISQSPSGDYTPPRPIAKVWDGYQDDRYSGHKLPKKFQDDAGTEQEPERQSQTIVTPEQKAARQAKVRKLAGNVVSERRSTPSLPTGFRCDSNCRMERA